MGTMIFYFGGLQNHCRWWLQPWDEKIFAPWKKTYDQPSQHIKKQRHYFTNKGSSSQSYGFSSSHVWMWELGYKEGWMLRNWCLWTVMLEKMLESPLDFKEIQSFHPKGNQSWLFSAEAEAVILWPPDAKHWLIWKDPEGVKVWGWEEKGTIEHEMVGWHRRLHGHEFGWTLGWWVMDRDAWRAVVHGVAKSQTRLRTNWTELNSAY